MSKNVETLKSESEVTQGHSKWYHSIDWLWLPIRRSIVTMALSGVVSEINGDFSRILQIFLTPLYFAPPLKGFPLDFGIGAGVQKTRMMGLLGRERSLTISSAVWIQYTNVTDGQTDGQTPGDSRPRLRIARYMIKEWDFLWQWLTSKATSRITKRK